MMARALACGMRTLCACTMRSRGVAWTTYICTYTFVFHTLCDPVGWRGPAFPPGRFRFGTRGGPVELYVLRLCAQAWPRFTTPSSAGGTRFPQVAGAARPARLVARKRRAATALAIRIVWARFPFFRKLSATSSPNLVARVADRRLPLMWSEICPCFGGYCRLMPSIAGEQPELCRSAHGDPSNRSLRSNGRHSDGSASPPPDFAPFWSYSCDGMRC